MTKWQATGWDGGNSEITSDASDVTVEVWMGFDEEKADVIVAKILGALNE